MPRKCYIPALLDLCPINRNAPRLTWRMDKPAQQPLVFEPGFLPIIVPANYSTLNAGARVPRVPYRKFNYSAMSATTAPILAAWQKNGFSKTRLLAGAIALAAIVEYVIGEGLTALAWRNPVYSYTRNYISDLGVSGPPVTFQGRLIYSPVYWVVNTGFIIEGVLAITAALLLRPLLSSKRWRFTLPMFAIIHGAGIIMVAIVHGSPGEMNKPIGILHVIGAAMAIIFGNIQCICTGIAARQNGAALWYKSYSIFMGLLGFAGLIGLIMLHSIPPGITERISVYTIIFWDITTGIFLLAGINRLKWAAGV